MVIPYSVMKHIIVVTDRRLSKRPFLEQIERICELSPKALILREKDLPQSEYQKLGAQVLEICQRNQVKCIFHTYPQVAEKQGAAGIHLPLDRLKVCGRNLKINGKVGVSVHSPEEAEKALKLGADYLTAGHVFATNCKKGVPPRGLGFLREICQISSKPVYGIGGMEATQACLDQVLEQGGAGICIRSVMMEL